jgi:1,4-alpha-glucan branching enzyme
MLGHLAIVLHAHLPYVRHSEHERPLEERWLHEAIWESYLPLIEVLDGLERDGVEAPITLSISPPLATMLKDELLRARFDDHLTRLGALAAQEERGLSSSSPFFAAARFYRERFERARSTWERIGHDVLGAFVRLARAGQLELWTSSATHAYLPGLLPSPASIRAQLRLGRLAFEQLSGMKPRGLWLPECAYDPRFDEDLSRSGVRVSILDAHGVDLASPTPPLGVRAPVISRHGVAFFGRDPSASHEVWSRKFGYPGHPDYREFYRDIGFERPVESLWDHVGPHETRVMTGIKLHRITGSSDKAPYDRALAERRVQVDADHFIARREQALSEAPHSPMGPPIVIAPYDAELFGHWWFEGPEFLDAVLRGAAARAREGGLAATTLGEYLRRHPEAALVEPAASSWGEGGFGEVWTGAAASPIWRHIHHTHRQVERALDRAGHRGGVEGRALEQAIRELMLLESSDWPFMLHRGEVHTYAETRVRTHLYRATRLAAIATANEASPSDAAFLVEVEGKDQLLSGLAGEAIRSGFDEWG